MSAITSPPADANGSATLPDSTLGAQPTQVVATIDDSPRPVPSAAADRPLARRFPTHLALAVVALLSLVVLTLMMLRLDQSPQSGVAEATTRPSNQEVVVGIPGGAVLNATPTASPQPSPTPPPPSPPPTTPDPIPLPTLAPTALPAPTAPPTAAPTAAAVVAAGEPTDAVASFYGRVASGDFDAAYALWSDAMRNSFPREANLDRRFDETLSIEWLQLETVARTSTTAQVQANFVETYESGGSRTFVGYWDLVLVDGRWLLDAPHY